MTSKDVIDNIAAIISDKDISVASVARKMGKSSQALNRQLNSNDIMVSTLLNIVNALSCDIDIIITDRADNKQYHIKSDSTSK